VAHEIAHMWFGNLVTHASWDEIWLNEAFATWIAVKLTDHFNPNWQVALQRRADLESVMQRDAGTATRAIRSGPVNERAVYDVLDTITYEKGGAVLSMLEQWIGSRPFQRGLASYIQERRYSNATAGDLWHHIGAASGRDVAAVARSWTDQPGYPLVTVNTRCHNGQTIARLGQRRFMLAAGKIEPGTWQIPMLIESAGNKTSVLLDADLAEIVLPGCAPLIVNAGGLGYYRVDYPAPARRELTRRFVRLEPADRVTLLSDRLALVQAGRVPAQEYFDLLAQLPRVEDASRVGLYRMAINGLALLDAALANTPAQPQLRAAARALLGPELARIGWSAQPGEDLQLPLLRSELILQLARFGDLDVIATARRAYIAADNGTALPAATRSAITQVVGTVADAAAFEQLRTRLVEARSEEERWIHALALARVNDPALADRVLKLSLEGSLPPNIAKELPALMAGLSSHVARAYDFTRRYWTELARLAGTFNNADAWLLAEAAMHSNDRAMITRLLRDDAATQTASRAPAAEAAERIRLLADVRDREAKSLAATLAGWRPAR
jgi:aminopeptidase N